MPRALVLSAFLLAFAAAPAPAGPARGPWLVDATSSSARVCWRPAGGVQDCRTVAALAPNTTFSYVVPVSTLTYLAKTLPAPGQPLRFVVFGDAGKATRGQLDVAALVERLDPDFILYTGDLVYPKGADADYDAKYFEPYARTLARRPVFPVIGNHDYGGARDAAKGQAAYESAYHKIHERPKWYAFSAGDARFFVIDTNACYKIGAAASLAADAEQQRWLEDELKARKEKWTFVALHVPLYATSLAHGDNALLRERLEPIFRRGAVTAVLGGHEHIYQRSKPQYGITHVTVGSGGGGLQFGGYKPAWLEHEEERYGALLVTVDARGVNGKFYGVDGAVFDEFGFERP